MAEQKEKQDAMWRLNGVPFGFVSLSLYLSPLKTSLSTEHVIITVSGENVDKAVGKARAQVYVDYQTLPRPKRTGPSPPSRVTCWADSLMEKKAIGMDGFAESSLARAGCVTQCPLLVLFPSSVVAWQYRRTGATHDCLELVLERAPESSFNGVLS